MKWIDRDRGMGFVREDTGKRVETLPPAWDCWLDGNIVGCVLPSRGDGHLEWHAHRSLAASEVSRVYGGFLGARANLDDAKRLVEAATR